MVLIVMMVVVVVVMARSRAGEVSDLYLFIDDSDDSRIDDQSIYLPLSHPLAAVDGDMAADLKAFPLKLALVGLPNVVRPASSSS